MPRVIVQPENLRSLGAASEISGAIKDLGPEWSVEFEGPRAEEVERRSVPGPEWGQISAQVYVTIAREAVSMVLAAIRAGAERWRQDKGRGGTVDIIVVEKGTGERIQTIHLPQRPD
jgi:hypothetical protein